MKSLLAIGLLLVATTAHAQCPGGVCPYKPGGNQYPPGGYQCLPDIAGPHWTYPGEIHSHLATGHGVNSAGMTRAQAEAEHDRLHNAERGYGHVERGIRSQPARTSVQQNTQRLQRYQRAQPRRVRIFGRW